MHPVNAFSHLFPFRSIPLLPSHLHLGLPNGLFSSGFSTISLYAFLISPMRTTYPVHLTLLDLINLTIFHEAYRLRSSSLPTQLYLYFFRLVFTATDGTTGVQFPAGTMMVFVFFVTRAHPASYPMGTRGYFPGGKAGPGHEAENSPPSTCSIEVKKAQWQFNLKKDNCSCRSNFRGWVSDRYWVTPLCLSTLP